MVALIAVSRSISAMCARGRARLASSVSISARSAASSSIRSFDSSGVATRPEDDSVSAPSATSRRTASRAGVIDTPNSRPMPRSVSAAPGAISPCMMRGRRLRYTRSCAARDVSEGRAWSSMTGTVIPAPARSIAKRKRWSAAPSRLSQPRAARWSP
jgi:hypothetical protein